MSNSTSKVSTGWNTMDSRPWNQPQLKNSGSIKINDETRLILGLNEFDMANSKNIRVKAYAESKVDNAYQVNIDSWADSIFYSGGVSLVDVCDVDRDMQAGAWSAQAVANPKPLQDFQSKITFKRKFSVIPVVIVWLTGFDFQNGKNFRIKAEAIDVTATGFNIKVATWFDSVLFWASASWIAYYPDSPRIRSGSYNTMDIRPWNKPQLADSGDVKFPGKAFPWTPLLFIGVNMFDIDADKGTSIRWKATASDVNADGFKWHNDSWFDTVKYSLGASYLALDVGPLE